MNASVAENASRDTALNNAIASACDAIAPSWPLDRMIAVNPYWGHVDKAFDKTAKKFADIAASPLSMPMSYYRSRWAKGELNEQHLDQAIEDLSCSLSAQDLKDALEQPDAQMNLPPLLSDSLDAHRDLVHEPAWSETLTHQISQFCAAYFDEAQADWNPDRGQSLYLSWKQALARDHSVALLMNAPEIPGRARTLAADSRTQILRALEQLDVPEEDWDNYLQTLIMRVSGWAAWCAYLRWQAGLADAEDHTLLDLLAIRLSWECLVDNGIRHAGSIWAIWQTSWKSYEPSDQHLSVEICQVWQRAHEISYQQELCGKLTESASVDGKSAPKVQAVFCIDVRSEVFRRHLESQSEEIQTLGFAGFFGLPISYTPIGTKATRPQLPGLLAPAIDISDSSGESHTDASLESARESKLKDLFSLRAFNTVPGSAFTLVETLGLGYAAKLVQRTLPKTLGATFGESLGLSEKQASCVRPSIRSALAGDLEGQTNIAKTVLSAMGMTENLAPIVLLIGHGSQNENNPQRAGLDCGACCGQTGEVNSRALADLLNDQRVREKLADEGLQVPEKTFFLAGFHNTTTDEITLFDLDEVPTLHSATLSDLRLHLDNAGLATRKERAPLLGLAGLVNEPEKLTEKVKQRANDWAQTRPEWGLANNAAFIVAPRSRTRGIDLAGRSFLHDYDYRKDVDGSLLELIMTAPMIVTHWINMQYFGSTVDNQRFGSGNKTLHNVVGGRLGVFEGNGGDLRTGLAWQSVHDGTDWRHEPHRITVVIDAPRSMIDAVIEKHDLVKNLVNGRWLYLARFEDEQVEFYQEGRWKILG